MIIADLIHADADPSATAAGRVYLSTAPFPGDTIRVGNAEFMVIRRTFLDLGPHGGPERLSVELKVRPL